MSGYDVLKQLRVSKIKNTHLILSGLAGIEDKVKGLGVGADDYMTSPSTRTNWSRASTPSCAAPRATPVGDPDRRSRGQSRHQTVEVGGQRVHLTGKEYQMLELLSPQGHPRSPKEMFLNHLMAAWTSRN